VSRPVYRLLLATHIVVSVGWLGVTVAKLALGITAATTGDPDSSRALYLSAGVVDAVFPPAAIGTVLTGVLLSLGTKWGLLQHYWVTTKLVLTVGVIATGVFLVDGMIGQSIATQSGQAADAGTILGFALAPASLVSLSVAHVLMLGAATAISVYKPWGKTRFSRSRANANTGR
jgi:uncharacterized membrane protein